MGAFRMVFLITASPSDPSRVSYRKDALNNSGQNVVGKVSKVLTVGTESLAAGFAAGDNYTCSTERNRRIPFHERTPNVPFNLRLRVR
jgi:hypothetical protein